MAMGIPVITNGGVGDVEEIVTKYNGGYVINDFSDTTFNSIINKVAGPNSFSSEQIRNGAKEFYALENAVKKYRKMYDSIFSK